MKHSLYFDKLSTFSIWSCMLLKLLFGFLHIPTCCRPLWGKCGENMFMWILIFQWPTHKAVYRARETEELHIWGYSTKLYKNPAWLCTVVKAWTSLPVKHLQQTNNNKDKSSSVWDIGKQWREFMWFKILSCDSLNLHSVMKTLEL